MARAPATPSARMAGSRPAGPTTGSSSTAAGGADHRQLLDGAASASPTGAEHRQLLHSGQGADHAPGRPPGSSSTTPAGADHAPGRAPAVPSTTGKAPTTPSARMAGAGHGQLLDGPSGRARPPGRSPPRSSTVASTATDAVGRSSTAPARRAPVETPPRRVRGLWPSLGRICPEKLRAGGPRRMEAW
jgi:hypothetical protein